jgi:hypothetical protein
VENVSALSLMQTALAIYDRNDEGATIAACHLQAAIDAATGAKPLKPGDEIDPELLAAFDARIGRGGKRPR